MKTLPFNLLSTKALVFDMDGTVTHNIPFHNQSWREWAKELELAHSEAELLSQTHGTISEIMRRFFPTATAQQQFERGQRKEALYRKIYQAHLAPLPGLEEFLKWARAQNLPLAIATAGDATNINFTIDGLNIRPYFSALVGSEDVTFGKPHPEVFLIAADKLGIRPEDCLAFEDSVAGVESARRAGMKCIIVNQMVPREQFGDCSHVLAWVDDYQALITGNHH